MKANVLFIILSISISVSASLGSSVIYIYILSHSITYVQLGFLTSIMLALSIFLEYPSGILADFIGRKKTFALGAFAGSVFYFLPLLSTSFYILVIAISLGAICDAFVSGSLEGWIQASSSKEDKKTSVSELIIKSKRITTLLTIAILVIVSVITRKAFSFSIILGSACIGFLLTSILALIFCADTKSELGNPSLVVLGSFQEIISKKYLWPFFVMLSVMFSIFSLYTLFYQSQANILGLGENKLLFLKGVSAFGSFLGVSLFGLLKKRFSDKLLFSYIYGALIFSLILFLTKSQILFVLAMLIFNIGTGAVMPYYFSSILPAINDAVISSAISLLNAFALILSVGVTLIGGYVLQNHSLSMLLMPVVIVVSCVLVISILSMSKSIAKK